MLLTINDANYLEYKKVLEIFWLHHSKYLPTEIAENASPMNFLEGLEKKSKTIAKQSLKEGLRDMISQLKQYPKELRQAIETDLARNNLPNTQILYSAFTNTIEKVLKRKKIKNLDEFYLIKEIVVDLTNEIKDSERNLLNKYLAEFEFEK